MRAPRLIVGDCLDVLRTLPAESVDACVCDPPYGLEFMGKEWDKLDVGLPQEAVWKGRRGKGGSAIKDDDRTPGSRSGVSYGGKRSAFKRCALCGRRQFSGTPCECPEPEWAIEYPDGPPSSAVRMQRWHERWAAEVHRVLRPGAHLIAFGGTRTIHRLACAIEDAGFEIRDTINWIAYAGFPKSLNVSKAIDGAAGAEREVVGERVVSNVHLGAKGYNGGGVRQGAIVMTAPATPEAALWSGWGTALKPAHEPAVLARKPLDGTVAANVLKWGTGALNLDACRYAEGDPAWPGPWGKPGWDDTGTVGTQAAAGYLGTSTFRIRERGADEIKARFGEWDSRFPANVYACPKASRSEREAGCEGLPARTGAEAVDREEGSEGLDSPRAGAGRTASAVRNHHPTVKPLALMRWLVRLVTPPGGLVIDPFLGSGTTGCAAILEGFRFFGIEREPDYARIAEARMAWADREREIATAQGDLFAVTPPLPGVPLPDRWREVGVQGDLLAPLPQQHDEQ